jgi:hypothetical protein
MSEFVVTNKPPAAFIRNRRLGLILAALVVLYIVAVIAFIIVY